MKPLRKITLFETDTQALLLIARANGKARFFLSAKPRKVEISFAQAEAFPVPVRDVTPDNHDGRHTGKFFEEFVQLMPDGQAKGLGVRVVEATEGRLLGAAGARRFTLKQSVVLMRCFKQVTIRASEERPMEIVTTLQRLEGMRQR
jgi:hypothetical protein